MSKVVLGGGLSGLSAAYYLTKKFPKQSITLIESSQRTGGWIKSDLQPDGTLFEQGPRTIRPRGASGANTLQLIEELGLSDQIVPIVSSHPAAKKRMIFANGSLHLLPTSLFGLFKKQTPFSKPLIFHLMNDLKAQKKQVKDESVYDFVERRFGKEVADYLISPLICGICAGNAREISVNFLMKQLFDYEQQYGSITKGLVKSFSLKSKQSVMSGLPERAKEEKWSIYSFKNGCESLPLALKDYLFKTGVDIKLNNQCEGIRLGRNEVSLHLSNNETITCDQLISSISSISLGELLQNQHPKLAQYLKKIVKNVSVGVVNLSFKENLVEDAAFGLLVAPKEKLPILGIIYDSCCFPKDNGGTVLTVMMGGFWFEQYFGKNPTESYLLDVAINQVKEILQVNVTPFMSKANILHNCLPQYIVGHNENLNNINDYIKTNDLPLHLCGASFYGVGINDVILSAKAAVEQLR